MVGKIRTARQWRLPCAGSHLGAVVAALRAELILFVGKKIRFIGADGQEGKSPAQGTCLYSFGPRGRVALENAARCGLGTLMIPASTVRSDRSVPTLNLVDWEDRSSA